jgi:lipoprotein signal peptidase
MPERELQGEREVRLSEPPVAPPETPVAPPLDATIPAPGVSPFARYRLLLAVAIPTLAIDLLSKAWAEHVLGKRVIVLVPGLFDLSLTHNKGAAWGMLHDAPEVFRRPFFVAVSAIASVLMVMFFHRVRDDERMVRWALALLLGGAVGNLVGRAGAGSVIDFLHPFLVIGGKTRHFPHFNVADIAINAGAVLLGIRMLGRDRSITRGPEPPPPPATAAENTTPSADTPSR